MRELSDWIHLPGASGLINDAMLRPASVAAPWVPGNPDRSLRGGENGHETGRPRAIAPHTDPRLPSADRGDEVKRVTSADSETGENIPAAGAWSTGRTGGGRHWR